MYFNDFRVIAFLLLKLRVHIIHNNIPGIIKLIKEDSYHCIFAPHYRSDW